MKNNNKPIIAIVGKPNVGKSTFFNKLIGQRISITSEIAGTTRDRIMMNVRWQNKTFTFIDTAGLDGDNEDVIGKNVTKQVDEALKDANLILFMVDGTSTIDSLDLAIADKLRKSKKKVMLLVNKAESYKVREHSDQFYSLGFGKPWPVSGIHGTGVAEVLDEIAKDCKEIAKDSETEDLPKIALVGRPNTGKSTLLNWLTNDERAIVSEIPGTTRDAISSKVSLCNKEVIFIDTAGIRKRGKIIPGIEKFSTIRTLRTIDESDLVIILIDGSEGFTRGDVHLITHALEKGKSIILAINKMDLVSPEEVNLHKFSFISKLPFVYISAKTGKSVDVLIERICNLI